MLRLSRLMAVVAGVMGLVLLLGACQAAKPPEVTITAKEYAFEMPESIGGGVVTLKLSNTGKEAHMAQLVRLNDGVTLDQLKAALQGGDPGAALGLVSVAGGIYTTPPGATQAAALDLKAGDYALMDFGAGEDQVPYMAKGMLQPFKVTAGSSAAEPASDVAVTMKEYTFEVPTELKAGTHTFKVSNQGTQPHEMLLFKLAEGKTLADVHAYLSNPSPSGPPPGDVAGGALAIGPGMRSWTPVELQPGNYAAICFIPDSGDGKSHAEHGMIMPIVVN
jgi:hypothetical protein